MRLRDRARSQCSFLSAGSLSGREGAPDGCSGQRTKGEVLRILGLSQTQNSPGLSFFSCSFYRSEIFCGRLKGAMVNQSNPSMPTEFSFLPFLSAPRSAMAGRGPF